MKRNMKVDQEKLELSQNIAKYFDEDMFRTVKAKICLKNKDKEEKEQIIRFFNQSLGNCRFVWNKLLHTSHEHYRYYQNNKANNKSFLTRFELSALLTQLKKEHVFLNETHSQSLQDSVEKLSEALTRQNKSRAENPSVKYNVNFKCKGKETESFIIKQVKPEYINFKNKTLHLPKLKKTFSFKCRLKIKKNEKVKLVQIIKENNVFYVNLVLCKIENKQQKQKRLNDLLYKIKSLQSEQNKLDSDKIIGIDFGIKTFLTLSNGEKIAIPAQIKNEVDRLSQRLIKLQQVSSKKYLQRKNKKEASQREKRIYMQQRKLHKKISLIKKDFLHKTSNTLSKNHACITLEDLTIKNMTKSQRRINLESNSAYKEKLSKKLKENVEFKARYKKNKLNRLLLSFPFAMFKNMLEYKMKRENNILIYVNAAYTSQCCNVCHYTSRENRTTQARFACVKCGHTDNADLNAAKNIKERGFHTLTDLVCGGDSRDVKITP